MLSASIQALHLREPILAIVTTQLLTLPSELILCLALVVVLILPSGPSPVLGWSQSKSQHCSVGRDGIQLSCGLWDLPAEAYGSTKKYMVAQKGCLRQTLGEAVSYSRAL